MCVVAVCHLVSLRGLRVHTRCRSEFPRGRLEPETMHLIYYAVYGRWSDSSISVMKPGAKYANASSALQTVPRLAVTVNHALLGDDPREAFSQVTAN